MSTAQKIIGMFIGLGIITTLVLPGRQSPQVIGATLGGTRGLLATAMGTGKQV